MRKRSVAFSIGVLAVAFLMNTANSISPSLAAIQREFPGLSASMIQSLVSLPGLFMIPASLLCGVLSRRTGKNLWAWLGLLLLTIGGVAPALSDSFVFILAMRALFGCGVGFITPIAPGMIADYYAGDEIKAMMGYQNASVSIGGIVTTVAAGYLCTAGWRYSFLIYLLGTLIMAYTFSVFRRGEPPSKRGGEEGTFMPNRDLSRLTIVMCGYGMLLCAFYSNVAMVVADRGIGDSALSGLIVITMNFGGLASSALYFQISRRLKGYAVAFAVGLTAVGFALLGRCSSAAAFFAGSAFIGIGFGIISSEALVVANAWSPRATTMAVSVYMSGVNLGGFLSPFIMGSVAGAIGGPRSRTILQISAVASLTAFAICVATARRKNRLVGLR